MSAREEVEAIAATLREKIRACARDGRRAAASAMGGAAVVSMLDQQHAVFRDRFVAHGIALDEQALEAIEAVVDELAAIAAGFVVLGMNAHASGLVSGASTLLMIGGRYG